MYSPAGKRQPALTGGDNSALLASPPKLSVTVRGVAAAEAV